MIWDQSRRGSSNSPSSTLPCPHSPRGAIADSGWVPVRLQAFRGPTAESLSALPLACPALLTPGTQQERTRPFQSQARARELPASPCASGSQQASANGGRSRPPKVELSLPSRGACDHRGGIQAAAISPPRKGAETESPVAGRGSTVLRPKGCRPLEATEARAHSLVRAAVVNTFQKRDVPVVTWPARPPMRSRGRGRGL